MSLALFFNYIYERFFWEDDLHKYDAHVLLELMEREDTADILYLGESSNFSIHPKDTQRLSISQLIDIQVDDRVATLNKGAYHVGIYTDLIKRIKSKSIHTLIVTLNMRTFNQATIHAPIETALQKQARLFKNQPPLLNRILLTLNAYDDASLAERDKDMWHDWTYDTLISDVVEFPAPTIKTWCAQPKFVDSLGVENMEMRTLADHYIKAYAFKIGEDNPRLLQLDELAQHCHENGYRLVLNLLAENVEYADSLCGPALSWQMKANRNMLVNRYRGGDLIVVDNLEAVAGRHYTDQHWTTEHYDEVGRQIIADNVAKALLVK
ncbi:MAG: hypothetical protein JXR19_11385 [Bacteroidia bacterium]